MQLTLYKDIRTKNAIYKKNKSKYVCILYIIDTISTNWINLNYSPIFDWRFCVRQREINKQENEIKKRIKEKKIQLKKRKRAAEIYNIQYRASAYQSNRREGVWDWIQKKQDGQIPPDSKKAKKEINGVESTGQFRPK